MAQTAPPRSIAVFGLPAHPYANPFADVLIDATSTAGDGRTIRVPGFFDGDDTWRIRFSPDRSGSWSYRITSRPHDPDLDVTGVLEVIAADKPGSMFSTPAQHWGFTDYDGQPVFVLGDTVYHLFGMAHCGLDTWPRAACPAWPPWCREAYVDPSPS